ncbi:head completion/stabilization protein [Aeromonas schubertii]|uniref:Head completion/stabilization protein n=1 Tax=Aeromonas schubertii TaxID=652 RepID=A0ABS7V6I3_9GAMM|nr:head completion/stabilization protein [Aeromonas schubertii]MBZ6064696.1 head completion/stabilization protein [Aeromonas schubertii]
MNRTTGFIPTAPTPTDEPPVTSGTFWPTIELGRLRAIMRTDGTITAERLRHAVIDAISQVNGDLTGWSLNRKGEGHATLADVPADIIDGESVLVHWYRRAVYSMARANLYERYLDSSATADAIKDAVPRELTADDLRRDARFAIRDILGITHSTVELI